MKSMIGKVLPMVVGEQTAKGTQAPGNPSMVAWFS